MVKAIDQPKAIVPKTYRIQDKVVPILNSAMPHIKSKNDSGPRMVERKVK